MAKKNYTIGRGGKRIKIDTEATRAQRDAIRQQTLEKYVVEIPTLDGSGLFYDQIQSMAEVMKSIYDETQQLITDSGKMIDDILENFTDVDDAGFGGGGSVGGRFSKS